MRQDDFANRTDPSSSDISLPRLLQVINKIKADPTIGANTEIVTIEKMSILMRKYMGLTESEDVPTLPINISLEQNYPNPFNPTTTINFSLANSEFVTLKVYDVLGREITTLVNEELNAGQHTKIFNANILSSGVYFYKLQAGKFSETKKMMLTK